MASKLEYLQRYMSSSGGDVEGDKKRKKKTKKTKKNNSGTRVVDADDVWQQSAPSREDIEKKWEMDAAEDEQPLVVADGDEIVDPQDLPVYVDSDKFMDEFKGRRKQDEDGDLSPPRKKRVGRGDSSEGASPPRRLKREDGSPPRRRSEAKETRRDSDVSPPSKQRRESNGDVSPQRTGGQDASPPRRATNSTRGRRSEDDASPPRRSGKIQSSSGRRGEADDVSPPRRSSGLTRSREKDRCGASPPRRVKKETEFSVVEGKPVAVKDEDASPPRRSRRDEKNSKREEKKRRAPSRSPPVLDRQRRVDSLGRDIPPRSDRSGRRSPLASKADGSRHRDRKPTKSRSRSRGRDQDRDASASPRRRRNRSRSQRSRRRRDSRSPSVRRQHSSRKSTRWESPRRDSRRHRSDSRSRGKRRSVSPPRRSRSRSNSLKHRSSRHDSVEMKKEPDSRDIRKTAEADTSIKRETSKMDEVNPKKESAKDDGKAEKKAGLFTATEFEQQRKVAAKSKDLLHAADASEMGANAETVYRDKRGRKLDMLNEMVRQQEVLDGKRKREEREEYEWGTGEVQKRERQSKQELLEQMKKTPFARHEDDEELERKRRERVRAFDPMNSKTFQEDPLADEGKSKRKSKKDKKKTSKAKPKYAGPPAPPNRFGIMPGYRWDGVVRGTNWEEKIMMRQNANTAVSEEAYKYAVADM